MRRIDSRSALDNSGHASMRACRSASIGGDSDSMALLLARWPSEEPFFPDDFAGCSTPLGVLVTESPLHNLCRGLFWLEFWGFKGIQYVSTSLIQGQLRRLQLWFKP